MVVKRFRVTKPGETERKGLAARNLDELMRKAIEFLGLSRSDDSVVCLEDGTLIEDEDYLLSLPDDTIVVVVPRQHVPNLIAKQRSSAVQVINNRSVFKVFQQLEEYTQQEIMKFFQEDDRRLRKIKDLIARVESRRHLSSRQEDPEWFDGLTGYRPVDTKEQYLGNCAKSRIRSYLADFKDRWKDYSSVLGIRSEVEDKITHCISVMKRILQCHRYYSCYFDRTAQECVHQYCDSEGTFLCQGKYNESLCSSGHIINPYDNKESRILLRTWNLDHIIERNIVIKTFVEAALNIENKSELPAERLVKYLFEKANLKMVHSSCHVISAHEDFCIDKQAFLS